MYYSSFLLSFSFVLLIIRSSFIILCYLFFFNSGIFNLYSPCFCILSSFFFLVCSLLLFSIISELFFVLYSVFSLFPFISLFFIVLPESFLLFHDSFMIRCRLSSIGSPLFIFLLPILSLFALGLLLSTYRQLFVTYHWMVWLLGFGRPSVRAPATHSQMF